MRNAQPKETDGYSNEKIDSVFLTTICEYFKVSDTMLSILHVSFYFHNNIILR
jgi:hypothetical protein